MEYYSVIKIMKPVAGYLNKLCEDVSLFYFAGLRHLIGLIRSSMANS